MKIAGHFPKIVSVLALRVTSNFIGTPEIKMLSVALLSQSKKSGCGIAYSSPCIAGDNILNGLEGFVGFCKVL